MKISNIIVSNENLNNLTATVSFDISETTKKVDVLIKINGNEFRQILTNQTAENIVYDIKNDLQLGINYVNIKLAHENEEYVSETFLIKLKSNPIIEGFSCPYSDSKGKFELNFTLRGDELFVYRIDLKLDDNEYQEIMSCQVQGEKKYVATSTVGNHTCKLRLYDGYDIYETESFSFEITNQKPILSNVLVTGMLNNGSASIHYAVKDIENSELTHTLTIDGRNTKINPTKVDKFCSYDINGLSVGKHNCYISVSDGIDTVMSEVFEIEIFISTTNKKTILQQAKARYDRAYRSLKDIILSVVSDGIFDYDIENAIIQKAQEYYAETYSEFNKIAQQSIDIIGNNKNEMTKRDLESQLNEVDRAILSLEDTMETTFRDGILTDTEKDILRNNLDLVAKEKNDIDRDYETLYNNVDLVDPTKTKLLNAYNEFIKAHNNLVLDVDRIINKMGIIDDNDKDGLSSLFEVWRGALGNYRVASLESIDSIAKKRVDDSADVLTKRWSDLQVDLNGIKLEVGSLEERVENVVVNVDTSVQTVQIMYYLSESVTELKGGTWLDVAPTWEQGKYMWSKTVTHLTNGDKTETKPVCIAGAKGQDGVNAIQYYTWVRYSSNEDGSNMTSEPNENTVYIGIAVNKTSKTPSENKEDYSWSKFMGDDGVNGKDGKDGTTTYTWIKYADDSNGNGLSNDPTNKEYIGFAYNKTTATESTNPSDYKWSLIKGTDGINAIQYYTWVRYSNSSDGSNMTSEPNENTVYIGIAVNKTSKTPSENKEDYSWSKFMGDDGVDGKDGSTTYTWIKYADNASGSGLSDSPTNKEYIGFAYNKLTPTESTNPSDYKWSLIKGTDGINATQYYTWVRYSSNADGSNMTSEPNEDTIYIGIAVNKTSKMPSENKEDYAWSKFIGDDGVDGKDGSTTYTWIKYADDSSGNGLSDNPTNKKYIGFAYNKTTATESTKASDYTWSLIKGSDGKDGIQYYTWVRYSNSSDGSNMYTTPNDNTLYIGIAVNKTSATPSTNKSDYTWSKFKGADGVNGKDGVDGTTTYTWIKYADNSSGSGLSDSPTNKTYIGFAYNKNTPTESTNPSDYIWSLIKGADGKDGIQYYTWVKYSDNADGTGLYDTPKDSTLYIGIAVNKTSKTESTNKSDYTWSKFKGADGVKGEDGVDGTTTYTWIKYADNSSGSGLSDSPTNKTYIGFAYNKNTPTESTNASDYAWSLIKGADGIDGVNGTDGVGVKNIVELYYLSTSKTTQTGGSWVTTCPTWVAGKYLWTRTKVEYTDGTIKYTNPLCDTSWEKTNELNTNVQTITKKVSDVEVKTDSITSTVSTMQTNVTNLGTRVTNAETKVTQLDNKITSSVTEDDVKSIIEQSPTEIRYGFNDISDYVTISSSGLTVNRGSVACDLLCTPSGHDPIIKLFGSDGNCAIDATKRYNSGWGTAIRLKWDDYNYYYISDNVATIYQYGYESFTFQTDSTYRDKSKIITPNGILIFDGSNTYDIYDNANKRLTYEGVPIVLQKSKFIETSSVGGGGSWYDKDRPGSGLYFTSGTTIGMYAGKTTSSTATGMFTFFWDTDSNPVMRATHTSKNLTFGVSGLYYAGGLVLTSSNYTSYCASSSHTHSNYASSSHTHSYASTSHTHNYASSSHTHNYASSSHSHSGYVSTSSSSSFKSGSHDPYSTNTYNLGYSSYRWQQVAAKNIYADYCSGSDVSIKENIRYIKPTNVSLFSMDDEPEEILNPNSDNDINLGVSGIDLYEFVKNDLKLCEYNYNDDYIRNGETGEAIKTNFDNKIGFIAQDLQDSYVGQLIVGEWEGQLSYNLNNYVSVLGGALQYEISTRDAQIESLESTISDLEERIKELENKLK